MSNAPDYGDDDPSATGHAYTPAVPAAKRRKTRKGTNSCWACKKRKEKCVFASQSSASRDHPPAICLACQRRGTPCVSQEFADEPSEPSKSKTRPSTGWVEALAEQLAKKIGSDHPPPTTVRNAESIVSPGCGIPTPATTASDFVHHPASRSVANSHDTAASLSKSHNSTPAVSNACTSATGGFLRLRTSRVFSAGPAKLARLSQSLHEALPTCQDSEILCKASYRSFYMFNQLLTMSYQRLDQSISSSCHDNLDRPGPTTHPVLIAKHMLHLAHLLQQFQPNYEELSGLSEPPEELLNRLADVAISQVTTQDRLLGSIESLECIQLESMYHANGGSLRLSWSANRRALHFAELMGLHRPDRPPRYQVIDPQTQADPQRMWLHIVQYDCSMSLHLGLPRGFQHSNIATKDLLDSDVPMGRLERIHCVITTRILDRNESACQDFAITQQLDHELQVEARRLPSKWWLQPHLYKTGTDDADLFWDIRRLVLQISHYNILNRLHLPYMLRASTNHNYQYSQIACVNASREILSRFLVLRNFNRVAFCCRTPDFTALMAAVTLVLAHLEGHRQASSLLVHQYLSDRAMMEQAQQSMEELSDKNGDLLSSQSADLLRRLLVIEAEAANSHNICSERVSVQSQGVSDHKDNDNDNGQDDGVVRVSIPYFGIIKIARGGIMSTEVPKPRQGFPEAHHLEVSEDKGPASAHGVRRELPTQQWYSVRQATTSGAAGDPTSLARLAGGQTLNHDLMPDGQSATNGAEYAPESSLSQNLYCDPALPDITAGVNDWAFQGVDIAFFESLGTSDAIGENSYGDSLEWRGPGA